MAERKEIFVIKTIIEHTRSALKYTSSITYDEYIANELVVSHTIICLQQIGEIISRLDDRFRSEYPDIPWSKIRALRSQMVHNYDGIRYNIVWNILQNNLPQLLADMTRLLEKLTTEAKW